ncbi:hypothetical protein [Amycolatopsis sp. Poz14]|uniref:hypothetical protein n=1 Tax=Amycolatopsis sp. Poz14 TaxID=1447705 RepID=UPI001EE7DA46|nr:hypothetical protein [Amycolatopsis sp. Poz14]MCG3757385.1 hypothetical protein [Amycolatopsis sp. Poz14]
MGDERTYIRVHDGIEDHPKVAALSDKAFRLLITTWGWCSRHRTDGRVPVPVWKKRGTKGARDELERAGLVEPHGDHVLMHDYLEHQRSAELIAEKVEAKKRGARLGNHRRWHEERGIHDPECEFCLADAPPEPPEPSPRRSHSDRYSDSDNRSGSDRKTSPETETETEKRSERDSRSSLPVSRRTSARDLAGTAHSPAAHRLVNAYAAECRRRPPTSVLSALAVEVDALLADGWSADEIAPVLGEWGARGLHPKTLASVAHQVANASPRTGSATSPTDAFAEQFLASGRNPVAPVPALRALPGGA